MGVVAYAGRRLRKISCARPKGSRCHRLGRRQQRHPFYKPDLHVVVFDPHRAGHETAYHPGETNMLMADMAIINKVDSEPQGCRSRAQHHRTPTTPGRIVLADSV
jgi:hypothetical protein